MSGVPMRYERELHRDPALCERIPCELPAAPAEAERIVRCSRDRVDEAICRALARAAVLGEAWRVEMVE